MGEAQTIQSLLAAQAAARARLDAVRRAEGARSRDYALAEQEVAEADAAVAGAREAMLRGRLEALRRAEAERGHLRAARAALLERIEGQAAAAAALHPLRREVESRSAALLALQTRSDALSAQRALWEPNVVVASEAAVPAEPSGPNRKLIAVAGTVAFGALTLLVAFLLEALRGTIGVRRDVEADFAIPALAELPAPPRPRGGEDMAALMTQAPDSPYARGVRALSYAVFPRGAAGVLVLAGVGADPRGARAGLCLGLAHALAADGARVALVSATGPAIGERAGAAAGPALRAASAPEPGGPGGAPQPGGRVAQIGARAGASVTGDACRALIEDLRRRFDVVLVDGGEDPEGPSARLYAPLADAALLVVGRGRTRRDAFADALDETARWPTRLVGAAIVA